MMPASGTTPRHLLLATDLTARCDRARDRTLQLAKAWGAKLTVVHALDAFDAPSDNPSRPTLSDAAMRAARLMRDDFSDMTGASLQVGEGRPADVILDIAAEKGCDLIVTGIAGKEPMGQSLLGSTVTTISRRAKVPVLVVKKRPKSAYRYVAVASDLSDASAVALKMALGLFDMERLTLVHVSDAPFRNWVSDKESYKRDQRDAALREVRKFLSKVTDDRIASLARIVVLSGDPAVTIADHAVSEDIDLVIAGTHGRTGLLGMLIGSVAAAILDEVSCDVMIVPN